MIPTTATTTSASVAAATARASMSGCGGNHTRRADAKRRGIDSMRMAYRRPFSSVTSTTLGGGGKPPVVSTSFLSSR